MSGRVREGLPQQPFAHSTRPPLDGIVVADLSRVLAGPMATTMLADLGAEVIKVERPGTGDDTRAWGPPWSEASSSYFACANRTKKSIALDLRDPDNLETARRIIRRADVLVENYRAGSLDRLGLGYDDVAATNPGIVYCSITGFGSGRGASLPGYDFVVQAVGGLMSITGSPQGEPTKVGVALVDVLTGKDAVIGILAALADRERTGLGQRIEVNLLSSLLGSLVNQSSSYLTTGRSPSRMGNQHPSIAPYETLRCRDGLLAIACGNDAQFARLAGVLGRPELAEDARFATNPARVANRAALVTALEAVLAAADAAQWQQRLVGADVPAGVVGDIASAFEFAESLGLEPTVEMPAPHRPQVRHPITFSRSDIVPPAPPPGLDEHGDDVRRWLEENHD